MIKKLSWIFLAIGLILLGVCAQLSLHTLNFISHAQEAPGQIVDYKSVRNTSTRDHTGWTQYPIVRFSANGQSFQFVDSVGTGTNIAPTAGSSFSFSVYSNQSPVTVLYDPQNPAHAEIKRTTSQWLGSIVTGLLGLIFTGAGLGIRVSIQRYAAKVEWLKANGQVYQARIVSVEEDQNVTYQTMGKPESHPWRIVAEFSVPDASFPWQVKSERIYKDPREQLKGISTLQVYVDPGNRDNYFIELPDSIANA